MLNNHPPPNDNPNITYINHDLPHFREDKLNMFEVEDGLQKTIEFFDTVLPLIARDLYGLSTVRELYDNRHDFDLVIVDHLFNEVSGTFNAEFWYVPVRLNSSFFERERSIYY